MSLVFDKDIAYLIVEKRRFETVFVTTQPSNVEVFPRIYIPIPLVTNNETIGNITGFIETSFTQNGNVFTQEATNTINNNFKANTAVKISSSQTQLFQSRGQENVTIGLKSDMNNPFVAILNSLLVIRSTDLANLRFLYASSFTFIPNLLLNSYNITKPTANVEYILNFYRPETSITDQNIYTTQLV